MIILFSYNKIPVCKQEIDAKTCVKHNNKLVLIKQWHQYLRLIYKNVIYLAQIKMMETGTIIIIIIIKGKLWKNTRNPLPTRSIKK